MKVAARCGVTGGVVRPLSSGALGGAERDAGAPLLEREGDVETVEAALDMAAGGSGSVLLIRGSAGIGKTRLLQEARRRATARGFFAAGARATELERSFAFGLVRQLFEPAVVRAPTDERRAVLHGAASLAAGLFEPDAAAAEPASGPADLTFRLMHGVYWLAANLAARQPLLIAVDDAHWGDELSLRWLLYLARRVDELPVLAVVTSRPMEAGAETSLVDLLAAEDATRTLEPAALAPRAVARLAREFFGEEPDAGFTAACHAATGGNPFLVTQLLAALEADGVRPTEQAAGAVRQVAPERVSRAVLVRVVRAGAAGRALARAVAVLGPRARLHDAARFAAIDEGEALRAGDALAAADVFARGQPLDFVHPIVRAAVYGDLPPGERSLAHLRAAEILADARRAPEEVSAHLLHAEGGDHDWIADRLREAAASASRRGAPAAAAQYLRRALEQPLAPERRVELLLQLGTAELRASDPQSVEHLSGALELIDDPRARGAVAIEYGRALMLTGRPDAAIDVFHRASAEVRHLDAELSTRLELELIGAARFDAGAQDVVRERLQRLRSSSPPTGPAHHRVLANLAFEQLKVPRPADELAALAEDALAGGELLAAEGIESPVFYLPMFTLVYCDRYARARELVADVLDIARRTGSALGFSMASCVHAAADLRAGDLEDALAHAQSALDSQPQVGLSQPLAMAALVEALLERGDAGEAARRLDEAGLGGDLPDFPLFTPLVELRARISVARGDLETALELFRISGERGAAWRSRNPTFMPWRSYGGLALAAAGEAEEARRLAREARELTQAFGAPRPLGIALRCAALLESGDARIDLLERAVAVLAPSPARLEHARALIDLGGALRRANRRRDSRPPLAEGLNLAVRCGADPLAERAREELRAIGARPRNVERSGVDALTPSERRVADLAAAGLSNPEIAQALFVTRKTVEMHLGRVYRKLDVSSRAQLPVVLVTGA